MSDAAIGHLVLADGKTFSGRLFGARAEAGGEAVFTTGMTGYQEVLTDPSYCGQIVCLTAPQIGNTGVNQFDMEAPRPAASGLVVHELSTVVSNWRSEKTLDAYMAEMGITGIEGIDTRALTRYIRDHGAQMAAIGSGSPEALHARAQSLPPMTGQDLTRGVSVKEALEWDSGECFAEPTSAKGPHIACVDFGVKWNILRCFADLGCRVTVLPGSSSAEEILALGADGVFLSNGPGDPAAVVGAIDTVRELVGKTPIFGICLGHQILSLALGATTYKLKFGHRGLNHPVKDLDTGRVEVTTQNHGFAVDTKTLPEGVRMTHEHLNDQTCMGISADELNAFSVQFHPEAGAGPRDSRHLFSRFVERLA